MSVFLGLAVLALLVAGGVAVGAVMGRPPGPLPPDVERFL